jgi:hypothetical protein
MLTNNKIEVKTVVNSSSSSKTEGELVALARAILANTEHPINMLWIRKGAMTAEVGTTPCWGYGPGEEEDGDEYQYKLAHNTDDEEDAGGKREQHASVATCALLMKESYNIKISN